MGRQFSGSAKLEKVPRERRRGGLGSRASRSNFSLSPRVSLAIALRRGGMLLNEFIIQ